jgi:hypothetical protein
MLYDKNWNPNKKQNEFTEQTEDRLTNGHGDSEKENSIIFRVSFSLGMNLSVEVAFITFSSINVHTSMAFSRYLIEKWS